MAYATVADVEALMGSTVDVARTTTLLDMAAAMIDAYNPSIATIVPPPTQARVVNANMVVRSLSNPLGVRTEQLASFSTTYGDAGVGMVMLEGDMSMLDSIPTLVSRRVYDVETPTANRQPFADESGWWWVPLYIEDPPVVQPIAAEAAP